MNFRQLGLLCLVMVHSANAMDLQKIVSSNPDAIKVSYVGNQTIVEYTLDPKVTVQYNDYINASHLDPYDSWEAYKDFAHEAFNRVMPADLVCIIESMRNNNVPTALLVHNAPIDSYIPPTPTNGHRPLHVHNGEFDPAASHLAALSKGFVSESVLFGICSTLKAYPTFDEREKDGQYINQIVPVDDPISLHEASSYGSATEFGPHTENVYEKPPLKFFALLCLRSDPKVGTTVIFLDDILGYIQNHPPMGRSFDWFMEQIKRNQFWQKTGPSFRGHEQTMIQSPILSFNDKGERVFRFNTTNNRTQGMNPEAQEAVDHLRETLLSSDFRSECYNKVVLKRGDLLMFNNWEIMHGRDGFIIDKDNWRWLQRCYFMLEEHVAQQG